MILSAWAATPKAETNIQAKSTVKANVLVIHSYSLELPWCHQQYMGIVEGFQESDHDVQIYHEFLDSKRYPGLHHRQEFLDYIRLKYQDTPLQLLMVADDPGLNLVLETHDEYFSDLPVVFMGINHVQEGLFDIPWITGVFETHNYAETFLEAKRQTGADTMIVIGDSSETGIASLKRTEASLSNVEGLPALIVLKDIPENQVEQTLGIYPDHWPIFMAGQLREKTKEKSLIDFAQDTQILRSKLPNPLYTNTILRIGYGAVGGKILEGKHHGQQAVQLATKILEGTPVSDVEPIVNVDDQWMFDAQELKRFDIDFKDLPADSILVNLGPSFYEQNRQLVWICIIVFSLGLITIFLLAYANHQQRRAKRQLRENERKLEQRVSARTSELSEALRELKHTQAQLIQKEKLSSLGKLVGGIAHEFNNPLSFMCGNLTYLEKYTQDIFQLVSCYQTQSEPSCVAQKYAREIEFEYIQEDVPRILESVKHGAKRINDIVCTLQEFSRNDQQGVKATYLNQSLDNTLLILNSRLSRGDIKVIKDYGLLPPVHCRPGEINQVFMGVLVNAIEAIEAANGDTKKIAIKTLKLPSDCVRITVQDTGTGIPEDIQDKVFDPFFTTKPVGKGMGLGLALCYQTIQQHQGDLRLQSKVGQGTTLAIELPIEPPEYPSSTDDSATLDT